MQRRQGREPAGIAIIFSPPSGSLAFRGDRPRASHYPWARTASGCPPTDKTTARGSRPLQMATRESEEAGPLPGRAWPRPTLTQRVVFLEHPLHDAGGRGAKPEAARPVCGGRGLVPGLSLSRSLSQQQPRHGRRDFRLACPTATARAAAILPAGDRGAGLLHPGTESLAGCEAARRAPGALEAAPQTSSPKQVSRSCCRALSRRRPREAVVRVHWLRRPCPRHWLERLLVRPRLRPVQTL